LKKSPKRIAIILPFLTLGGAETQALNVVTGLKNAGVDVKIFAFSEKNGSLKKKLDEENIPFELFNYDLNWIHQKGIKKISGLISVIKQLRSFKPNHLFPFTYYPNIVISSIWKLTGAQSCYWNQRGMERIPVNAIEKLAIKMKPSYLSNSISGAKFISNRHQKDSNSVKVISNGVVIKEPQKTKEQWKTQLQLNESDLCYVMVANLYPEKNHDYLLGGWKTFCSENEGLSLKLILVGYSSQEIGLLRIKSKAYDLNLNNIIILDSSNDISGLLQICNAGILTSESEGCPNAVLEYMHWNKPAIVSKIDATEEIFDKNYLLFCDLKDPQTLVQALNNSLNSETMTNLTIENKQIIKERYSVSRLIQEYLDLL
jgi:glycosyltransferase involved in cell wall biosynthesis